MYFYKFLATNNKYITVNAYSHIESTSGRTLNIYGTLSHNTKVDIWHPG